MTSLSTVDLLTRLVVSQCEQVRQLLIGTELSQATRRRLKTSVYQDLDLLNSILYLEEGRSLHWLDQGLELFSAMQCKEGELLEVARATLRPTGDDAKVSPRHVFAAKLMALESEVGMTRESVVAKIAELRKLVSETEQFFDQIK